MLRKVTGADVAAAAGCSTSAVSRAFRPGSPISDELRTNVLLTARRMGYTTPSGESIAAMTMGTITLVAGDLENPFYAMAANQLSLAINARGRRMILHAVPPGGDVDTVMSQVLDYRTDAAIVTSALMSSRIARECRRRRVPVVLFNRVQPDAEMTAVTCDNYGGGRLVAQRLIAAGRRRIALIGGRPDTSTHLERARGFGDVLRDAGLPVLASRCGHYEYAGGLDAARDLLASAQRPDAIFALNDVMALGALDAARETGSAVPDDLMVIGFDDIPAAAAAAYRLTTVRQPVERMVADALDLVEAGLADPDAPGAIRVTPVELVERSSG